MRLALALGLTIPGLLLLATPALPIGALLILAGWWVYERSPISRRGLDDGFITLLMVLGGLGVVMTFVEFGLQVLRRL
jgi:hypothetical protein